jgi:PPP family 3-phenylpropionic acid transporter
MMILVWNDRGDFVSSTLRPSPMTLVWLRLPIALLKGLAYDEKMNMTPPNSHNIFQSDRKKIILAAQYFLYFGVMGAFLPYFNLYCYKIGFNGVEIGNLAAARQVAMIIFPLIWGTLADRFKARRPIFIFASFAGAVVWGGLLLTADYGRMLLIVTIYGVFYAPLIPFLEAFTMDILGGHKKSYGRTRLWGSIAFISMVLGLGWVIDRFSIKIILSVILVGSLLQSLVALIIPNVNLKSTLPFGQGVKSVFHGRFIIFMISAFIMLLSHGAYYSFFSIHLNKLGYSTTFISSCWALASTAEIGVMLFSDRIFKRFSLKTVIIFSFLMAVIRWTVLYRVTGALAILGSQLTHAVTYGTFHMASILYVDRLIPKEVKTLGQGINNALTYGLGLMVGFYISGNLYEHFGTPFLFALSAILALVGGIVFAGFEILRPRLKPVRSVNHRDGGKRERATI